MKIHVIDHSGKLSPSLWPAGTEVTLYEDEIQALRAVERFQPSVVLLNYDQQRQQSPQYVQLLLKASPLTHVIIVGNDVPEGMICECLLAGAKGYQHQAQLQQALAKMLSVVQQGEAWVSRKLVARLLDNIRQRQCNDSPLALA